jgi:hypothetical protein
MSEKRIFNVGYIEYPNTTLIYDSVEIDASNYPELEGKTDDEVIEYIKENAWEMNPTNPDVYDSLGEELSDQDIIREKIPHVDSEVWAEVSSSDNNTEVNEEEDNDDDE